jgi:hypothetical protein
MTNNNILLQEAFNKLFKSDSDNYIFVYTPPKVGSTTLVTSLRVSLGKSYNIIHIHDDIMLNVLTGLNVKVNDIIEFISNLNKNVYVIDIYRTIVERKMSEYFEKLSPYHFNNTEENISKYNIDRIINRFNKLFPYLATEEHYFCKYNIQTPTNFDFEKKYTIQVYNNIKYIKLRLFDSNNWGKILTEILKTKIVLINDYITEDKPIGKVYSIFKNIYKLPSNYFNIVENCPYLKFYYSDNERNIYLKNWTNKISENFTPYTKEEYDFYVNLYLENQYYNDIQFEHYIDNGCFCNSCNEKRKEIYFKVLNNEKITDKIIHKNIIESKIKQKVLKTIKTIQTINNKNNNNFNRIKKPIKTQFKIHTNLIS